MHPTAILTLFLLLSPLSASSPVAIIEDGSAAYKALEEFNFPVGLLPKGAVGYELDEASGRFRAYLNGSCGYSLEGSYELKYKSTISGYISENRISSLTGISVKVLFLWLNIVEVVRKGDELELSVGIASASFPLDNFYECPQCGCGFDCDNGQRTTKIDDTAFCFFKKMFAGGENGNVLTVGFVVVLLCYMWILVWTLATDWEN